MNHNNQNKIIIAIDGYSSSGKSTLAKNIAKKLQYKHIDSGSMYRCITLLAIRNKIFQSDLWNKKNFIKFLKKKNLKFIFKWNEKLNETDIFFNEENIRNEIRSYDVNKKVSLIAKIPEIRNILTKILRHMGKNKGIVVDGRDIGNHVFPKSELKFFLTSSLDIRAYRRYNSIKKKGKIIYYEEIKKNIIYRDNQDTCRKISPLKKSLNHIEIDNTFMNVKEQFNFIYKIIKKYTINETIK
ncbi:(d)CMP kinase [Blattabacterium cuenoti]|uniref:(d)CMP kinase n=1 Tax=Blattabacterium cuenoti TaxID=1653831 RepID=UPI00163B9980|nr:(d)CMP kinase [Blattabacterium cuenoti]